MNTSYATDDISQLLRDCDAPQMVDMKRTYIRVLPSTEAGRLTLIEILPKEIGAFKSLLRVLPSIEVDDILRQLNEQYTRGRGKQLSQVIRIYCEI